LIRFYKFIIMFIFVFLSVRLSLFI